MVLNIVMRVSGAFGRGRVDTVFHDERRKRSVGGDRLSNDHVTPRSGHSVCADADFHAMKMHRAIVATLHVVFACPHEFDWRAAHAFGDRGRFPLHVRVSDSAPAKTSADHLSMKSYLLGFESQHLSHGHLI